MHAQNILVGRLGITVLLTSFGEVIVDEDFNELRLQESKNNDRCCLLHDLLSVDSSLTRIYIDTHSYDSNLPNLIDFLCLLLRYNSEEQIPMERIQSSAFMR